MSPGDLLLRPGTWPLLVAAPLALVLLLAARRRRRRRVDAYAGPRTAALAPDGAGGGRGSGGTWFALGVLLAAAALLQPAWGESGIPVERRPVDIVVCLDVSRSMLARDVAPSRLEAARRQVRELARRATGERMALVAFAGEARLVVPLTDDLDGFAALASTADPLTVPRGGTDLGAALDEVLNALGDARGSRAAVFVLTDGEDLGGAAAGAAERCAREDVVVHGVACGTERGGKIPVEGERGEVWQRDAQGREVVTVADRTGLAALCAATGGVMVDGGGGPAVLADLYDRLVLPRAREELRSEERKRREQRFQWPLLGAVLFLLGDAWSTRRRVR